MPVSSKGSESTYFARRVLLRRVERNETLRLPVRYLPKLTRHPLSVYGAVQIEVSKGRRSHGFDLLRPAMNGGTKWELLLRSLSLGLSSTTSSMRRSVRTEIK